VGITESLEGIAFPEDTYNIYTDS